MKTSLSSKVLAPRALAALAAGLLLGCGSTTATSSGASYPSREATCQFDLLTAMPAGGFSEIGTIDVTPGAYGFNVYRDLSAFGDHVRPNVCQMGGDAVVASANGFGMYIQATVLKSNGEVAQAAAAPATGGCHVDTQCKGDRVCVSGACVDPSTK